MRVKANVLAFSQSPITEFNFRLRTSIFALTLGHLLGSNKEWSCGPCSYTEADGSGVKLLPQSTASESLLIALLQYGSQYSESIRSKCRTGNCTYQYLATLDYHEWDLVFQQTVPFVKTENDRMATATVLPFSPELMDALRSEDIDIGLPQTKASDQLSSSVGTTTISSSSTISLPSSTKRGADTLVSFDPASLRARYDAERDKRLAANPTGLDQYISVDDQDSFFRKYLDDPYIRERIVRDAIEEETRVVIIGGGFGGQLAAVRLIEHGISDIRIIEKGGDFGGTW